MVKKMNVPKLRFPEFNDEYNLIVLNDILFSHNAGIYIEKSQYGFGTNIVGVSNLYDNTKIDGQFFRFAPLTEDDKINYLLDENDIIYGESSLVPIGIARTLAVSSKGKNTAFEWHTRRFKINNDVVNSFYLSYMFNFNNKIRKRLASVSTQTALTGITTKDFFSTKFYIPKLEEQNKVVKLIDLLDKKIELQTKKIEALKLFKTGLFNIIQNLMCESEYLLKDIVTFGNGKGHENIVDENGNYVLINSKFISTEGAVIKKCTEQLCPLKENDIVMVMSDLPNGKALAKCFYVDENDKYSLNQRICLLRANNNINPQYLFYKINRNPYYLKFDDGVNQTNLKKEDILNLVINLPNIEYQNKYSQIMISIDKKIKNEKTSLTKLFKLKKGLMQNLFV